MKKSAEYTGNHKMKKKIAIVNQRYGADVNGGSEYYTKKLAEHLSKFYDVEVITTTALDYDTWKPYYKEGIYDINGVRVRRFDVKMNRKLWAFKIINTLLCRFTAFWRILEPIWLCLQGPYCPNLVHYISDSKDEFDIYIFVTYLYYTTIAGLPKVAKKAILVPTAHDEYCIYLHAYKKIFTNIRGIVYLTEEEKAFVEKLFYNSHIPHVVAGSGIDITPVENTELFRSKYQLLGDYLIYIGRVDTSKKCDVMFTYFSEFKRKHPSILKLVVIGKMMMKEPKEEDILCLGFISEKEKYMALDGALALIMPSEHESLSLSVLESLAFGIPVIVNGACSVLKSHCQKSNAGLYYRSYEEFEENIMEILQDKEKYTSMQYCGKKYIDENYSWDMTINKYKSLLE